MTMFLSCPYSLNNPALPVYTTAKRVGFGLNLSDETLIRHEATLIHRILEQVAHMLEGLQSFPRVACDNASVLLGEWLIRKGFEGVEYVSGSDSASHRLSLREFHAHGFFHQVFTDHSSMR